MRDIYSAFNDPEPFAVAPEWHPVDPNPLRIAAQSRRKEVPR